MQEPHLARPQRRSQLRMCTRDLSKEEVLTPFMVLEEEEPVNHKSRNTELYRDEKQWLDLIATLN